MRHVETLGSRLLKWAGAAVLAVVMLGLGGTRAYAAPLSAARVGVVTPKYETWLNKQVRHKLEMLPWYGIFDELSYSVNGKQVVLNGKVVNPATKGDAQAAVKSIEGVTSVVNNIQILPPSPMDNQIRWAEYRSIFSADGLYRYAMGVNPSIHIIVENGRVTLVGYVNNKADAQLADMRANAVPGVFSVKNDLRVTS